MAGSNDLFPGPGQGMNGLTPWGDPEAYASAAASSAMEPIIRPYLRDVFTGQKAYDWANRNFGPNADSFNTAMELGLGFGPGIMAGPRSLTANIPAMREMERLEGQWPLQSAEQIHNQTGWFRDEGFSPTYTIPDTNAALKTENFHSFDVLNQHDGTSRTFHAIPFGKDLKLGDIFDHPDMYEAYPFMKDVNIRPEMALSEYAGLYNPLENTMYLRDGEYPDMMRRIIHESQHVIENHEGWAQGGTPDQFLPPGHTKEYDAVKAERQDVSDQLIQGGFSPMMISMEHGLPPYQNANSAFFGSSHGAPADLLDRYISLSRRQEEMFNMSQEAQRSYMRLAGEVKARVAESMFMQGVYNRLPESVGEYRGFAGGGGELVPYTPSNQQIVIRPSLNTIAQPGGSRSTVMYDHGSGGYREVEPMPEGFVPPGSGQ